ncbi:hypothetical protein [Halobacillus sp. Marseille-Q1614]|uniref:hypothetical protein n=1 Tax=Halobacillus sp. Marseille-Q1614 TaxID=2709134 RepID=UPI00156DFC2F|nr:hypothetical protein [Halobacillus sp. Marseille-Q1614]
MTGIEGELPGFQSNPNDIGKCSSCGIILRSRHEKEVMMCKDCQNRHRDREDIVGKDKK